MKEKELRLALVFFGGVSLAIYEHGINREILNLVRASKLYHSRPLLCGIDGEGATREPLPRFNSVYADEPAQSTGDIYARFIEQVGEQLALRVIVDVISGASAGAINGIALARALAHDLSLAPLTDLWLNEADMLKLLAPQAKARLWSKWYFWPFIGPTLKLLHREGLLPGDIDAEMQKRISVFLRSRWFKPPLDGRYLAAAVFDGLEAMENTRGTGNTLLPSGTRLDLLVTATDFRGLDRLIFIHNPPVVQEREHRHLFRFRVDHHKTGHLRSDVDLDGVPSLSFAARASASYPGAFPPAQLREIDDFLASRRRHWSTRTQFLTKNFSRHLEQGKNPDDAVLVDGSVLDNKPIMATIEAIRSHSAFREVDRRLIYIDPHSQGDKPPASLQVPGFFTTLRGALSDLPRNDPIYNELADISRYNKLMRRLKETITAARPQVEALIARATDGRVTEPFEVNDLRRWRLSAANMLAVQPILYDPWMRALVLEAVDFLATLISVACGFAAESVQAHQVQATVEHWARRHAMVQASYTMPPELQGNADLPVYIKLIVDFGLVYKKRRLHFVLNEINELYDNITQKDFCSTGPENLDLLKIKIHKLMDTLSSYDDANFLSADAIALCRALFAPDRLWQHTESVSDADDAALSHLINRLGIECDLARCNDEADAVIASALVRNLGPRSRSAIVTSYLGYLYWDILLRPMVSALFMETGPIEEILIDRISPDDATRLKSAAGPQILRGAAFAGFGGFLSRAARENDYLWGRLHAVERLFDILASTLPAAVRASIDIDACKKAAFHCVVDEESHRLSTSAALLQRIRAAIEAL